MSPDSQANMNASIKSWTQSDIDIIGFQKQSIVTVSIYAKLVFPFSYQSDVKLSGRAVKTLNFCMPILEVKRTETTSARNLYDMLPYHGADGFCEARLRLSSKIATRLWKLRLSSVV